MNRKGFTLMEVLVTAGIVAFLAALLYPVGQKALIGARSTKSLGQMRIITQALAEYSQENSQSFPPVSVGGAPWCRIPLDPYLPMRGTTENIVFSCPNARADSRVRRAYSAGGAMYGLVSSQTRATDTTKPRRLTSISNASRAVLMFDAYVQGNGLCKDGMTWETIKPELMQEDASGNTTIQYRHNGAAHFAFADLHIETLTPKQAAEAITSAQVYEGL